MKPDKRNQIEPRVGLEQQGERCQNRLTEKPRNEVQSFKVDQHLLLLNK